MRVSDLMSREIICVEPENDLALAHELMQEHHIRHLPVVNGDGEVVGLLSHRDLLRQSLFGEPMQMGFLATLREITVADVMTEGVATAAAETDIRHAAQLMLDYQYGCLPVVREGKLVGILTEADFVRLMAEGD